MNKILLTILAILFMTTSAHALIVIYDSDTKEVYSVGSFDDTLVPDGYEKAELKGKMKAWDFPENPTNCFFKDGRFVVNTKKLSDEYKKQEDLVIEREKEVKIQDKMRDMAIKELEKEGQL